MPSFLRVREPTDEEVASLTKLIEHARYPDDATATDEGQLRARIVLLSMAEQSVKQIAYSLGMSPASVRTWIKRFNNESVQGLQDRQHPGRPQALTPAERDRVITIAQTSPRELGLPFDGWTLDLLYDYCTHTGHLPVTRDILFRVLDKVGWVGRVRRPPRRRKLRPPAYRDS